MNDDDLLHTIDAVRAARYALLTKPGALAGIKDAMSRMDGDALVTLRAMLADDLRTMRRLGMRIPKPPGNDTFPTA